MILNNVIVTGTDEIVNIRVGDDKISEIASEAFTRITETLQLTFNNAIIFPGLINAHDHLDFNLFPQLGDRTYPNYTEWGNYIHKNYKNEIAGILKIPDILRAQWGIYKNLLCGVTTVVNHGEKIGTANELITVFEESQSLHSVHFEKGWKIKLNNPFKIGLPVIIHAGEGSDLLSTSEIGEFIGWNLFRRKLIGVHAVAMSAGQAKSFKAIVWCPYSNYFLLNKTAPVNLLKKSTDILFGTDSTLTSNWNIWEHLQLARKTNLVSDKFLYHSLNQTAARIFKLNSGEIATTKDADLVVAKFKKDKKSLDAFFDVGPADILLVMHKGKIRLFDETLLPQLKIIGLNNHSKIYIDGTCKYVAGDLPGLIKNINGYNAAVTFPVSTTKPA